MEARRLALGIALATALAAAPATAAPGDGATERPIEATANADPRHKLLKIASAYIAVWDLDGRAACAERRPACEHMEDMLDRAARALQDAHRSGAAILVFQTLLDPQYHLDHTDRARMAPYEIGVAYQSIGAYAEAAGLFERFAEEREAMDPAPPSLEEAARLRLRLGQRDKALTDLALFQRLYARKQPERLSRITLSIAARDEQEEDWEAENTLLTAALPAIDRSAPLEARMEAHARMARVLIHLDHAPTAAMEMGRVLVIARDRASALAALRRRGKDAKDAKDAKDTKESPLDAAVEDLIAEARFIQAEQKRDEALRIQLPPYRGAGDRASVQAYLNSAVRNYLPQKQYAIQEAERAYLRVFGIELPPTTMPVPPSPPGGAGTIGLLNSGGDPNAPRAARSDALGADPSSTVNDPTEPATRWKIAAAARVGALWGDLVTEMRSMPIPREWQGAEELRGTYYQMLDPMDEPWKQRAKAAFQTCLKLSRDGRRFDEHSSACEAWLTRNYRSEYHAVEELFAGPMWVSGGLVAAPAVPAEPASGARR